MIVIPRIHRRSRKRQESPQWYDWMVIIFLSLAFIAVAVLIVVSVVEHFLG